MSGPLDLIGPGDLVFDVGANIGDHAARYVERGARVIAFEPQPRFHAALAAIPDVTVIPCAVGAQAGEARMWTSSRYPHLSTFSDPWRQASGYLALHGADVWDQQITVPVVTLQEAVLAHGEPRYLKLDVEGFEPEALAGLDRAPPLLSFEVHSAFAAAGDRCLYWLRDHGRWDFNLVDLEGWDFDSDWSSRPRFPAVYGDVFARRA